jgi:DNA-binding CsgD family transcriptional regulator
MAKPKNLKGEILKLRNQGLSYNKIARDLNCSKNTIYYHCKKNNLNDIGLERKKIDFNIINSIKLYSKEHTISETAIHHNVSISTVRNYKLKD